MPDDDGPKFTGRDWAMILGVPAGLALVIGLVLYFQVLAACDAARIGC